jgi:hypothetical protein
LKLKIDGGVDATTLPMAEGMADSAPAPWATLRWRCCKILSFWVVVASRWAWAAQRKISEVAPWMRPGVLQAMATPEVVSMAVQARGAESWLLCIIMARATKRRG